MTRMPPIEFKYIESAWTYPSHIIQQPKIPQHYKKNHAHIHSNTTLHTSINHITLNHKPVTYKCFVGIELYITKQHPHIVIYIHYSLTFFHKRKKIHEFLRRGGGGVGCKSGSDDVGSHKQLPSICIVPIIVWLRTLLR